jgi:hypothetical protein
MRDLERDEVRERVVEFGRGMARMRECLAIAARAPSPVAGEHRIARRRGEANVVADNRLRFGRMESGKLDEEQARMSDIVDHISANAMLLCNESFSSTNEREGSQIAREVITALVESDITVLLVTHMFDLANGFYERRLEDALFLRAERGSDGARSFKISEGKPLPTSYGEDSYRKAFGRDATHPADARTDAQRSASRG